MRKTLLALTTVLSITTFFNASAEAAINWMGSLQEAQQVAQQQQRPLLLHFYTDWCGPCRRLDSEVFPRADVAHAVNSNYIAVKINAEKSRDIAGHFEVDRFPMDVIVEPSGRVLVHTVTPGEPGQYIEMLNKVAQSRRVANPPAGVQPMQGGYGTPNTAQPGQMSAAAAGGYAPPAPDQRQFAGYGDPRNSSQYGTNPTQAGWSDASRQQADYAPAYSNQYNAAQPATQPPHVGSVTPVAMTQQNPYATGYGADNSTPVPMGTQPQLSDYNDPNRAGAIANPYAQGNPHAQSNPYAQSNDYGPYDPSSQPSIAPRQPTTPLADRSAEASPAPLALEGYCAVTLAEKEAWEMGVAQWGAVHRGRTYLFTSQAQQQKFLSDPDRYSPILSGIDPTRFIDSGAVADGKRNHGMWFRGKMYLFSSEESLQRFQGSPEYYAQRSREVMMRGAMR